MRTDLDLIADLIASRKYEAAERMTRVLAELEVERDAHERYEFELTWMLRHARDVPCTVTRQVDGTPVLEIAAADPHAGPCDYILLDCPRLRSLLKGEVEGMTR